MSSTQFQNYLMRFQSGERVFASGEPGTTMFIVQSGHVRLYTGTEDAAATLAVMGKGEFFGEMSLLEGAPRIYSAEALELTELIEINSATFDRMVRTNIDIAVRMIRKLSVRLSDTEAKLESLTHESYRTPEPPAPELPAASVSSAPPAAATSAPARAPRLGPRLLAETGELSFSLTAAENLIGRYDPVTETQPAIDLTALDTKRSVSRRHAVITASNGNYFLREEAGSLNGTFLNSARVITGRPVEINDGDVVGIGAVRLVFRL